MLEIEKEPCTVVKYYKLTATTYTTYHVFIIHNETTGEIKMTSNGMSMASYEEIFPAAIETFKKQMGLDEDGKKLEN